MNIYIEVSRAEVSDGFENILSMKDGRIVQTNLINAAFKLDLADGNTLILFGEVFYQRKKDGRIHFIDNNSGRYLKRLFSEQDIKNIIPDLEGQYIGIYIDKRRKRIDIFSDRYARLDTFYVQTGSKFYFGTDLDFIFSKVQPDYDQRMIAHVFSVFGWYTPKGLTIYDNVKQPRVGEIISLSDFGVKSEFITFKPFQIENYGEERLEEYYKIIKESVISRANRQGTTWVSSSSGWDSSLILGLLVDEFGPKRVGMLTGSMKYSDKTALINKFEIDKIKKIGRYYGIKPNIVEFNFKDNNASDYWRKLLPFYKSKHMYGWPSFNFSKLSDGLTRLAGEPQVIFNGETSDSFHNFGFSQFGTFFHTKKQFTEYADKMNCYLYGPSFMKKVLDGSYEKDRVYQIFMKMMEGVEFETNFNSRTHLLQSYLFPLFYGSPRIPFAKTLKNTVLTEKGQQEIFRFPFENYMPDVTSRISDKNIYSWIIYLYNSFHSQGATVNIQKHAMELNGHRWRSPYNDYRMIEFLSKSPEKWGRGLELNNTKYPLKWVAKNKIRFPYETLDEGPHSYLYDVIEGFSLAAEVTYRSGVTEMFKESLSSRPYRDLISGELIDVPYLDKLCSDYLNGLEAKGRDFNNLFSLITFVITGWY